MTHVELRPGWRREALRTSLWWVPTLEVGAAFLLFWGGYLLDRAAYNGSLKLPSWVISGNADASRQILAALAAAVITVIGVVFSVILVALTLAANQLGPRMLRNFMRDRGTQWTLGTFVGTFTFAILVLISIGPGKHGDFVPHASISAVLFLSLVDVFILIYFIHHIAVQIQLPYVIASIAADVVKAIEDEAAPPAGGPKLGPAPQEILADAGGRARRGHRIGERIPAVRLALQARPHRHRRRRGDPPALPPRALHRRRPPAGDRDPAGRRAARQGGAAARAPERALPLPDAGHLLRHRPAGGDRRPRRCPRR